MLEHKRFGQIPLVCDNLLQQTTTPRRSGVVSFHLQYYSETLSSRPDDHQAEYHTIRAMHTRFAVRLGSKVVVSCGAQQWEAQVKNSLFRKATRHTTCEGKCNENSRSQESHHDLCGAHDLSFLLPTQPKPKQITKSPPNHTIPQLSTTTSKSPPTTPPTNSNNKLQQQVYNIKFRHHVNDNNDNNTAIPVATCQTKMAVSHQEHLHGQSLVLTLCRSDDELMLWNAICMCVFRWSVGQLIIPCS